jgi:hypothetical protein
MRFSPQRHKEHKGIENRMGRIDRIINLIQVELFCFYPVNPAHPVWISLVPFVSLW